MSSPERSVVMAALALLTLCASCTTTRNADRFAIADYAMMLNVKCVVRCNDGPAENAFVYLIEALDYSQGERVHELGATSENGSLTTRIALEWGEKRKIVSLGPEIKLGGRSGSRHIKIRVVRHDCIDSTRDVDLSTLPKEGDGSVLLNLSFASPVAEHERATPM